MKSTQLFFHDPSGSIGEKEKFRLGMIVVP